MQFPFSHKKTFNFQLLTFNFSVIFFVLIISACIKPPEDPNENNPPNFDTIKPVSGIYILNEGLFNMNNTSLSYFSFADSVETPNFFELVNGRKLGDTGSDLAIYGSKIYIVVNISGQVEVVQKADCESIKQIPVFDGEKNRQPRSIAFANGKAFVCSFDGTVAVIDTVNLEIEKYISVGRNPDGIAYSNGKIYVSNSGGLDFPDYDNTVSVIDVETLTEIKKIEVGLNPYTIIADNYGDVYVVSRGNYSDVPMRLQIIDSEADELKYVFTEFEAMDIAFKGDTAYVAHYDFATGESSILMLDLANEQILRQNFITDNTQIETVYGVGIHPLNGEVYISDVKGFTSTSEIFCFSPAGKKKFSFSSVLNPRKFVFR